MNTLVNKLKFDANGLIPAVIQDAQGKQVLMVAFMNRAAVKKTLAIGKVHFYSRSRQKIWLKGETSGHLQRVRQIFVDCDRDCLLIQVAQTGGACHEGYRSCFFQQWKGGRLKTIAKRVFDPERVYRQ